MGQRKDTEKETSSTVFDIATIVVFVFLTWLVIFKNVPWPLFGLGLVVMPFSLFFGFMYVMFRMIVDKNNYTETRRTGALKTTAGIVAIASNVVSSFVMFSRGQPTFGFFFALYAITTGIPAWIIR